jgi:hypothetical protein
MNREGTNDSCDRWMDYVSVTAEASLPLDFRMHMKTCAICREEWRQLRIVWEALALDTEQLEVPETLKSEVMEAIFGDTGHRGSMTPQLLSAGTNVRRTRLSLRRRSMAAAACVVAAAIFWGGWKFALPLWNPVTAPSALPSQTVLKEWTLSAVQQTMPAAKASIRLVRDGNVEKVIVSAEGLAPTANEQSYQVWLLHEQRRYNCGTFRVGDSGNGALVYDLKQPDVQIDGFGITLEPDAQGTAPRGMKVLGTSANSGTGSNGSTPSSIPNTEVY